MRCLLSWNYNPDRLIHINGSLPSPNLDVDVVKTRMQTSPEKYKNGVIHAATDIIRTEGVGFLFAGLGNILLLIVDSFISFLAAPTVVGYGLEGALKFGFYETFKKLFATLTSSHFVNFLLASVVAGAVASIVLVSHL